jgi:hypothetical protein
MHDGFAEPESGGLGGFLDLAFLWPALDVQLLFYSPSFRHV